MISCQPLPLGLRMLRQLPFPRKLGVLERIYGKQLAVFGKCWVKTAAGLDWQLDLADVCHRWIVYGDYEGSLQMRWLRSWLAEGGNVVDSGANVGEMAQYFAVIPRVKVFCVEPLPDSRAWLEGCLKQNAIASVTTIAVALSDAVGECELQVNAGRSTLNTNWYAESKLPTHRVQVSTLDQVLDARGVDRIRLWKLDVEGWELKALMGAKRRLQDRAIDAILIEVVPERFDAIKRWLGELNYVPYRITSNGLVPVERCQFSGNVVVLPT